jgi:hypothetical protein
MNQFWGPIKHNVDAINKARTAGIDCNDIQLPSLNGKCLAILASIRT